MEPCCVVIQNTASDVSLSQEGCSTISNLCVLQILVLQERSESSEDIS